MIQISIRVKESFYFMQHHFAFSTPYFEFETWKDYTKKDRGMNFFFVTWCEEFSHQFQHSTHLSPVSLEFECLGLFPGEDFSSKVTIAGSLLEDWVLKSQVLYDFAGSKIKVL
jgi:hypothetical protein